MSTFVSLSSVGASPALPCTAVARTTMAQLSFTGACAGADVTIQGTLDNIGLYPTPAWTNISTTHYSTASAIDGVMVTLLTPVAGLRLSSSAGTYTAGSAFVSLRILQQSVGVG